MEMNFQAAYNNTVLGVTTIVRDGNVSLHVSLSDTNTALIRCSSSQRKPHVPLVVPIATVIFIVLEDCQEIRFCSPHSLILKGSTVVVLLLSTQNNVYVKNLLQAKMKVLGQNSCHFGQG